MPFIDDGLAERAERVIQVDHLDIEVDLKKSNGNFIYDSKRKKYFLDCFSYIASNPLGHNHRVFGLEKNRRKLLHAAIHNPTNSDVLTPEFVSFLETFRDIAMPTAFKKAFFIAGGSAAVENALKTAFDWKYKKLKKQFDDWVETLDAKTDIEIDEEPYHEKLEIAHFTNAFHGRGGYTLSLTNTADPRKYAFYPKFNWPRFDTDKLDELAEYIQVHPHKLAAIIVEPIQGEGGDVHFNYDFHLRLRRLADKADALLIYDEVQTGVGLTGAFWAYQHTLIIPDIVVFGKKMQVCGIMVGDKVLSVPNNVFEEKSRINSTWGGNLTDFVRSEIILKAIRDDNLVEQSRQIGNYLQESLDELFELQFEIINDRRNYFTRLPLISGLRGKGLMIAFDLPTTDTRNRFLNMLFEEGVIALGCGTQTVRVRPSLTFGIADSKLLVNSIKTVLEKW